jgi:hypothetical protein
MCAYETPDAPLGLHGREAVEVERCDGEFGQKDRNAQRRVPAQMSRLMDTSRSISRPPTDITTR